MGYFFTSREFEEDRIPKLSNYPVTEIRLGTDLTGFYREDIICGANINGAGFHGGYAIGSDIDVIVVIPGDESKEYLRELNTDIKNSTHVPVEFVPIKIELAQSGDHTIDFFYAKYVKTFCRDGRIPKNRNTMSLIKPREDWDNPAKEVRDRFDANLSKLSKRSVLPKEYDREHCALLENIVRQPIYAAIDMLRLIHGNYPSKGGRPLAKAECCELYKMEFPRLDTSDLFLILGERNRYRRFLEKRKKKKPKEYIQLLDDIEGVCPNAERFIEMNLEFLPKLIKSDRIYQF